MLSTFYIAAFTHRNFDVSDIGQLHIAEDQQADRLKAIKELHQFDEFMFLSTCNRVEFSLCTGQSFTRETLRTLLIHNYEHISEQALEKLVNGVEIFKGADAVSHILKLASSVDSMIIGEREIITQVRNAYEAGKKFGITGDFIRMVIRQTIESAKKVYTDTAISTRPVSVVSLAFHHLKQLNIPLNSRILIIGAGMTNTTMSRFLKKHGFIDFAIFNRTFEKAQKLAIDIKGKAYELNQLGSYCGGFDVIITCTGADYAILTPAIYEHLLGADEDHKIVIDLAIPHDLAPEIKAKHALTHFSVDYLQKVSKENQLARATELEKVYEILDQGLSDFKAICRERKVELAMRSVPQKVKEITAAALNDIFAQDIEKMDDEARATLEKVIGYMEKKYMSVPMKMAKEILINS